VANVLQTRPQYHETAINVAPVARRRARPYRTDTLSAELTNVRREYDELRRTLYDAAQVQRRLCGPRKLHRGAFEIACEIFPLRHLSGDFISLTEMNDDEIFFAIGDIAGKGIAAAMWFSFVMSLIRLSHARTSDPAEALTVINRDLMESGLEPPLASLFLGRLNTKTGQLAYCNAGHPPALLLRASEQPETLSIGGPILGALPKARFANGDATLQPGDYLLAYSDGIPECRNATGSEFGVSNLVEAASCTSVDAAESALFSVLAATAKFSGTQPREDDMAIIAIYRGQETESRI
jgi:serine phosphatase RsbU (regulator of sigma subunit)